MKVKSGQFGYLKIANDYYSFASSLAIWDAAFSELRVGFFSSKINDEQKRRMIAENSFSAIENHFPDAVIALSLIHISEPTRPY